MRLISGCTALVFALALIACRRKSPARADTPAAHVPESPTQPATAAASRPPEPRCPQEMELLSGGRFWVGAAASEHFSDDESPRFLTELPTFCLDRTEVTVAAYDRCVANGACESAARPRSSCNGGHHERAEHPINCVTFTQAAAYCRTRGARLPSEVEWEYAARGGARLLRYPWGDAHPDGRACWKQPTTCKTASYPAGAFGIYDLSGNVWEWTDTWYGAYPWPPEQGFAKVYRGGSYSRRFEKWMHTRLRDRMNPTRWGAHLGFRCALRPTGVACPFGEDERGRCRHGVLTRDCPAGKTWNGVRCASPGAPRCQEGRIEKPGFGCVVPDEISAPRRDFEAEARGVSRRPSPEFDEDCRENQPRRPHAFRYAGGTHDGRNLVVARAGCKNRDVGVGWNSACCP